MAQPPFYPVQPPKDENLPKQVRDYIEFHKKGRECLLNPDCKEKPKVLVACCPKKVLCLGLGYRMSGLVFSFTMALVTKRVLFRHKFSTPFPLKVGLVPSAIDWTLPPTVNFNDSWPHVEWYWCHKGIRCVGLAPHPSNFSNFDGQGEPINMNTNDIVNLFDEKPFVSIVSRIRRTQVNFLAENPYLNGTHAELSRNITLGQVNVHRLLFKPSEATRQKLKAMEFEGDYYSVHIRSGVDAREASFEKRFQYLSTHEEEAAVNILECLARIDEKKSVTNLFLASDSTRAKEIFKRKANEKGFIVHLIEEKTMHYEKDFMLGSTTLDSKCDGFLDIYIDLFMLARAKIMIATGSHFSWLAGLLGRDQRVIGIYTWQKFC